MLLIRHLCYLYADRADHRSEEGHPLREVHLVELDPEALEAGFGLLVLGDEHRETPGIVDAAHHRIPVAAKSGQILGAVVARQMQQAVRDAVVVEAADVVGHRVQETRHRAHQQLGLGESVPGQPHIGARVADFVDQVIEAVGGHQPPLDHLHGKDLVVAAIALIRAQSNGGAIHGIEAIDALRAVPFELGLDRGRVEAQRVAHRFGHKAGEGIPAQPLAGTRIPLPAAVGHEALQQLDGLLFLVGERVIAVDVTDHEARSVVLLHLTESRHLPDAGHHDRRKHRGLVHHRPERVESQRRGFIPIVAMSENLEIVEVDRLHAGLALSLPARERNHLRLAEQVRLGVLVPDVVYDPLYLGARDQLRGGGTVGFAQLRLRVVALAGRGSGIEGGTGGGVGAHSADCGVTTGKASSVGDRWKVSRFPPSPFRPRPRQHRGSGRGSLCYSGIFGVLYRSFGWNGEPAATREMRNSSVFKQGSLPDTQC